MAGSCNILNQSLSELEKDGVIDRKTNSVKKIYTFEQYVKIKTKIVEKVYKVDLKNEKLFTHFKSNNNNWVYQFNGRLFDEVQKYVDAMAIKPAIVVDNSHQGDERLRKFEFSDENAPNATSLSTVGFLDTTNKTAFAILQNNFFSAFGVTYSPEDNSAVGRENQSLFYKFIAAKGYNGIVIDSLEAIAFFYNRDQVVQEVAELELEKLNPQLELFDEALEPTKSVITSLDRLSAFSADEINYLSLYYTESEVNEMLDSDEEGSMLIFKNLLFDGLYKNNTFVSKEEVNNFNRRCK